VNRLKKNVVLCVLRVLGGFAHAPDIRGTSLELDSCAANGRPDDVASNRIQVGVKEREMRKRYRVLMFASLVAALVVPVGYALSVESMPLATPARYAPASSGVVPVAAVILKAPMTIHVNSASPAADTLHPVSDAAKLFGIGTLLFGLAAFVRKAI
jgi:hypothetical protein